MRNGRSPSRTLSMKARKSMRRSVRLDRGEAERHPHLQPALQAKILELYMQSDRVTLENLPTFVSKLQLSLPPDLNLRTYVGEALADNPCAIVQPDVMFRIVAEIRQRMSGGTEDPVWIQLEGDKSAEAEERNRGQLVECMQRVFPSLDTALVATEALLPPAVPVTARNLRTVVGEDSSVKQRLRLVLRARGAILDELGHVMVPASLICAKCRELRMSGAKTQNLIDELDPYGTRRIPLESLERQLRHEFQTQSPLQPAPISSLFIQWCAPYVASTCGQDYVDALVPPMTEDLEKSTINNAPPTLDMLGARLQVLSTTANLKRRFHPHAPASPATSRGRPRSSGALPSVAPTTARALSQKERYRSFLMDSGILSGR